MHRGPMSEDLLAMKVVAMNVSRADWVFANAVRRRPYTEARKASL